MNPKITEKEYIPIGDYRGLTFTKIVVRELLEGKEENLLKIEYHSQEKTYEATLNNNELLTLLSAIELFEERYFERPEYFTETTFRLENNFEMGIYWEATKKSWIPYFLLNNQEDMPRLAFAKGKHFDKVMELFLKAKEILQ